MISRNIIPHSGESVKMMNLVADNIASLPGGSLDVHGDIVSMETGV